MKKTFTVSNTWTTSRCIVVEAESYEDALIEAGYEDGAILCRYEDKIYDDHTLILEADIRNAEGPEQMPIGYVYETETGRWDTYQPGKGYLQRDVSPPSENKGNVIQFRKSVTRSTH